MILTPGLSSWTHYAASQSLLYGRHHCVTGFDPVTVHPITPLLARFDEFQLGNAAPGCACLLHVFGPYHSYPPPKCPSHESSLSYIVRVNCQTGTTHVWRIRDKAAFAAFNLKPSPAICKQVIPGSSHATFCQGSSQMLETSLPREIIQLILVQLPINTNTVAIGLASKFILAPLVFADLGFACWHLRERLALNDGLNTIWDFYEEDYRRNHLYPLAYNENAYLKWWKSLPLVYKCAIYEVLMEAPNWVGLRKWTNRTPDDFGSHYYYRHQGHIHVFATPNLQWPGLRSFQSQSLAMRAVKLLVERRSFNISTQNNRMIRWAAINGYDQVVGFFMGQCHDSKLDPTAEDNQALRLACDNRHVLVVKLLLSDSRVDPSCCFKKAMETPHETGRNQVLRLLLAADQAIDPSTNNNRPLVLAVKSQDVEMVKFLLRDSRVDPMAGLDAAIGTRNAEIFEMLFDDYRTKVSDEKLESLFGTMAKTRLEVHMQHNSIWDFHEDDDSSSNFAIQTGYHPKDPIPTWWITLPLMYKCAVYRMLMETPNWVGLRKWTERPPDDFGSDYRYPREQSGYFQCRNVPSVPNLQWPGLRQFRSQAEALRVVKLLVESQLSFDFSIQNNRMLRWAAINGHEQVVAFLLGYETNKVDPSAEKNQALRLACKNSHHSVVHLLLSDSRVNACSASFHQGMKVSYKTGCNKFMRLILEADPAMDPSVNNNWPLVLATRSHHIEMVQFLLRDSRVDPAAALDMAVYAHTKGYSRLCLRIAEHEYLTKSWIH
ncbi:hypothetical protein BDR26DRAFT_934208 [Obelidium mucronatum]|nr:hypothetical protein BDR26DRAFT_934208 [Obelidium mucronatum]